MIKQNMTSLAINLFLFIIESPYNVKTKKGKPYKISSKTASDWFYGYTNIYENLIKVVADPNVLQNASENIGNFIESSINPDLLTQVYDKVYSLVNEDETIPSAVKKEIIEMYVDEAKYDFMARAFLYAITVNNEMNPKPSHKRKTTDQIIDEMIKEIERIPKPVQIVIPKDLKEEEMEYVQALLSVYSEKSGVTFVTKDDLENKDEYKTYKDDFEEQRKYYYAAESLRMAERDTETLHDKHGFESLEDEVYDGVIDTVRLPSSSGYERLHKVLQQVTTISLNCLLSHINGWVENKERKGICHMLVKDKGVKWKNEK